MRPLYISYPDSEHDFAQRLVADLQARNYAVFMDAVSNPGSPAWANETRRAIRTSGALIMILSPEEGRRTGTRHEGVLALRGNKPFVILQRTSGELPRYAHGAAIIDCTGDYDAAFRQLLDALPSALELLRATPAPRPQPRPPRQPEQALRRRLVFIMVVVFVLIVCAVLGVVFDIIPV